VNQFASLAFIAETEAVEGRISWSMIAVGVTVYDADALLEYSNTLYDTTSVDYSHAHTHTMV
jgi:hypothetical protein